MLLFLRCWFLFQNPEALFTFNELIYVQMHEKKKRENVNCFWGSSNKETLFIRKTQGNWKTEVPFLNFKLKASKKRGWFIPWILANVTANKQIMAAFQQTTMNNENENGTKLIHVGSYFISLSFILSVLALTHTKGNHGGTPCLRDIRGERLSLLFISDWKTASPCMLCCAESSTNSAKTVSSWGIFMHTLILQNNTLGERHAHKRTCVEGYVVRREVLRVCQQQWRELGRAEEAQGTVTSALWCTQLLSLGYTPTAYVCLTKGFLSTLKIQRRSTHKVRISLQQQLLLISIS